MRQVEWAQTPLGPEAQWSASLRSAVGIVLASAFPMALRWGPDFVLIYNDAYRPILGDKHPWAFGRPVREAWSEVWAQIAPNHEAILRGDAPSIFAEDIVLRIQRHGTTWEDAHFTVGYSPVADPTAPTGIGGVLVTAVEITDKVAAQETKRLSEERYELALEATGAIGTWDWDILNDRLIANAKFAELYSVDSAAAARGEPLDAFLAGVHPADLHNLRADIARSLKTVEDGPSEYRLLQRDGSTKWVIARGRFQVDRDGRPVRQLGAVVDITDRKRIEEDLRENMSERRAAAAELARSVEEERATARALAQLNATLEERVAQQAAERDRIWQTSQDLLVVVDAFGRLTAVSPSWRSMLGWQLADLIGRDYLTVIHPEDRATGQAALTRALQAPLPAVELRCLHQDGGFRWISWVATSERGLVYATGRNVTAEKGAAAELAAVQEALRQSQKMEAVGQLTGGIAHDFNNMLVVVMGSLELLGRRLGGGDGRAQRCIEAATEAARRASLLTQRLLAFSRQQPLQPEAIDANKLVAGMSELIRRSIGSVVRLETVLAGGLWRTHADPNQLENIVLNLALNARDAMPEGGRLTIETQNAHLDERYVAGTPELVAGQYVLIAVTDTGGGMPASVIEKAFDPFFTTKPVGKGTGLGLSQVYGFVKQTGGHVKIYSEVGEGTTVKIYLPRLSGASVESGGAPHEPPPAAGELPELVLLVEDEPAVRQYSAEALRELGYRVLEAESAAAALELLEAHPDIDLLFTDVVMPDVNGARLAAEARRRKPDLKVLFTTGYTRSAVVHNGVLDPGVEMIGKPFTLDALATKIRFVLDT